MVLVLLSLAAFAQDTPPADPAPASPEVEEVPEVPEPPVAEPQAEPLEPEEAPELVVELGPVHFLAERDLPVPALTFDRCVGLTPPGSMSGRTNPPDGQLVFQVKIRKGKVALSSVASSSTGLDFVTPCLQRELASVEWPVKRAEGEIHVQVGSE